VDWIVSMAKMKTHHWAGVTLSMKNLFGVMPGSYYGWPKNVLHWAGINETILDIYATLRPHLTIVDGIIGMEGDGAHHGYPSSGWSAGYGAEFSGSRFNLRPNNGNKPLQSVPFGSSGGEVGHDP
jgi:hypothetical protein